MDILLFFFLHFENAGVSTTASDISIDEKKDQLTLTFASKVNKGGITIALNFVGCLNDKMAGFYRSTYKGADGSDKVMVRLKFFKNKFFRELSVFWITLHYTSCNYRSNDF